MKKVNKINYLGIKESIRSLTKNITQSCILNYVKLNSNSTLKEEINNELEKISLNIQKKHGDGIIFTQKHAFSKIAILI
jgi:predicted transcriptional regulator